MNFLLNQNQSGRLVKSFAALFTGGFAIAAAVTFLRKINNRLSRSLHRLPLAGESADTLTYNAVMSYFITDRPEHPAIKKGAVVIDRLQPVTIAPASVPGNTPSGYTVFQLFLDKDNTPVSSEQNIPYGRKITCTSIDSELLELAGKDNLIIVE